jgi:hypothetical protein
MVNKFTKTQLNYLKWLLEGNFIQVSMELFMDIGEITYSSSLPFKSDRRALENLKKAGMFKYHQETQFGISWMIVSLSDRAIKLMEEQS